MRGALVFTYDFMRQKLESSRLLHARQDIEHFYHTLHYISTMDTTVFRLGYTIVNITLHAAYLLNSQNFEL
jgi:hypothetical protein